MVSLTHGHHSWASADRGGYAGGGYDSQPYTLSEDEHLSDIAKPVRYAHGAGSHWDRNEDYDGLDHDVGGIKVGNGPNGVSIQGDQEHMEEI